MSKIKSRSVFYFHTVCISALFTIGQFIITLPFTKSPSDFIAFLLSAITGVLLCLLISPVLRLNNKIIKVLIFITVTVYSAFVLADTFKTFCGFAREILFKGSFSVSVIVSFFAVCLYFALAKTQNILKFSLISFIYSVLVILFFIILLLPNLKLFNLYSWGNIDFNNITNAFAHCFSNVFLPVVLLKVYQNNFFNNNKRNAVVWGVLLGTFILAVLGLSAVLLFGSGFTSILKFPLVSAISTVSVGKLFSRLDLLFYFIFFFSCLLRIAVCGFIIKSSLKNIDKLQKN